jgi:SAM-dependent methyltransferase
MASPLARLPAAAVALLRCPVCHGPIRQVEQSFVCSNESCRSTFPVVEGIPILINVGDSIFSIDDFVQRKTTTLASGRPTFIKRALKALLGESGFESFKRFVRRCTPTIDKNLASGRNYARLAQLLSSRSEGPRVLVLGGGILGDGIDVLMRNPNIEFVESDVSFGPRTSLIMDAHDIPFEDGTFDAVVAQAVLEHVADPYRCVAEIRRVLKNDGLIYSETPFMQQVHAGRYDFTRFTHLGHRRLFRQFEEIESGIVCGPGMSLAWAYQYFLTSLFTSRTLRGLARNFARLTSFFVKYADVLIKNKPGSYDSASGFYLLGRKSDQILSDRDLIRLYRGLDSQ